MVRFLSALILMTFVIASFNASGQIRNARLGQPVARWGQSLNPVLALNHKHVNNITVSFAHQVFYSMDAGATWSDSHSDSTKAAKVELIADARGNYYSFFIDNPKDLRAEIFDQESIDEGKTWTTGTSPLNTKGRRALRPHASAHFVRGLLYLTWTEFEGASDSTCQSNVFFSNSNERKWSSPVRINQTSGTCTNDQGAVWATAPLVSMDGRLFLAWFREGDIYFDRSYDAGKTWLTNDFVIGKNRKGLGMKIPGVFQAAGTPSFAIDNSMSFFRSSLYLVWSDQTTGDNDSDIWFLRSTTRGDLWSLPVKVNQDSTNKHQFCPWVSVDKTTGIIYIVYYDRRNHDDLMTDVYMSYSVDGGHQFKDMKVSETSFMTSDKHPLCDHPEVSAEKGLIAVAWTRVDEEGSSVWTAVLKQDELIKKEEAPKLQTVRKK